MIVLVVTMVDGFSHFGAIVVSSCPVLSCVADITPSSDIPICATLIFLNRTTIIIKMITLPAFGRIMIFEDIFWYELGWFVAEI